jgi:hypothetical protein
MFREDVGFIYVRCREGKRVLRWDGHMFLEATCNFVRVAASVYLNNRSLLSPDEARECTNEAPRCAGSSYSKLVYAPSLYIRRMIG